MKSLDVLRKFKEDEQECKLLLLKRVCYIRAKVRLSVMFLLNVRRVELHQWSCLDCEYCDPGACNEDFSGILPLCPAECLS